MKTMHPNLLQQLERLAIRTGHKSARKILEVQHRRRSIRRVK